jgi:hypothetical protein
LPADSKARILEPVKPVITRWNSFCSAFERAVQLQSTFNYYIGYQIDEQRRRDEHARAHNNKLIAVPAWMRTDGLTAADWAVITEYIDVLKPLKMATTRLEGRGRSGRFGAIYEVIPVFEYLLEQFEERVKGLERVNYAPGDAPEDHILINSRAAWLKLKEYYSKLDNSPVYYMACCLHPYYKRYCDKAWNKESTKHWIADNQKAFQQLWAEYKTPRAAVARRREPTSSAIDDAITAIIGDSSDDDDVDEYEMWRTTELKWSKQQFESSNSVVKYWQDLQPRYPNLSRLAIDILTIPASSCECERMFSELGDLLAPRRRKIGSQLLAALQCIRTWMGFGFKLPNESARELLSDSDLNRLYNIDNWDTPTDDDDESTALGKSTAATNPHFTLHLTC